MTHRAYKFRIYPTPEQETVLRKTVGSCRFVYNWALEQRRESWASDKKTMSYGVTSKFLTSLKKHDNYLWLNDVSSVCLQQSLRNLDEAFVSFFKKNGKYPNFKARKNGGSARFLNNAFRIENDGLFLAKIKTPIKVAWSRKLSSESSQVNISQSPSGQWFASFLCEEEISHLSPTDKKIGVDVGIESFCTTSDGQKFSQPKKIKRLRKKLARLQRLHSRKAKGSKNREKARHKLARIHQHVSNVRKDFLHKLSTQLVRENQAIALEDLAVSNMMKNRHLARAIGAQGWRDFRIMLEYKCEWYGRELLMVDRFYPSSKTCSCCGAKASLGLETRRWTCGGCGANHDRDVNAAKNILAAGLAVSACGESIKPTEKISRGSSLRSRKVETEVSIRSKGSDGSAS